MFENLRAPRTYVQPQRTSFYL